MALDEQIEQGRRRHSAAGLMMILLFLFAVLAGVVLFAQWQSSGLNYTLRFTDAQGLRAGDPVMLSGVQIGEVRKVDLVSEDDVRVAIHIPQKDADKVKAGSTAVIADNSLSNVSGQMVVEIHNSGAQAEAPMRSGSLIQGRRGTLDLKAWELQQELGPMKKSLSADTRALADKIESMARQLKDVPDSPEAKQAMKKLEQMTQDLQRQGKAALSDLSRRWDELSQQYGPEIAYLKDKGQQAAQQTLEKASQALNSATRQLGAPASQPGK